MWSYFFTRQDILFGCWLSVISIQSILSVYLSHLLVCCSHFYHWLSDSNLIFHQKQILEKDISLTCNFRCLLFYPPRAKSSLVSHILNFTSVIFLHIFASQSGSFSPHIHPVSLAMYLQFYAYRMALLVVAWFPPIQFIKTFSKPWLSPYPLCSHLLILCFTLSLTLSPRHDQNQFQFVMLLTCLSIWQVGSGSLDPFVLVFVVSLLFSVVLYFWMEPSSSHSHQQSDLPFTPFTLLFVINSCLCDVFLLWLLSLAPKEERNADLSGLFCLRKLKWKWPTEARHWGNPNSYVFVWFSVKTI